MRSVITAALLLCSGFAVAQQPREGGKQEPDATPETVHLRVQSRIDLPATFTGGYTSPLRCGEDGTVYTQFFSPRGSEGLVGISRDGKVTQFSLPNDTAIQEPSLISAYPISGSVMVHLKGQTDAKLKVMSRKEGDRIIGMGAARVGPTHEFVATFGRDGKFKSLVQLEVPFDVGQVAPFRSGMLLVSGMDRATNEPRVGLADQDGRFLRTVHLVGDISQDAFIKSLPTESDKSRPVNPPAVQFAALVGGSSLLPDPDADEIVLMRNGQAGAPVFAIAPSGEVRVVRPKAPAGYAVFSILPTKEGWITMFSRDLGNFRSAPPINCLVDRHTGTVNRCYQINDNLGFGFACFDSPNFLFLKYNVATKRNQLLVATPWE